MLASKLLSSEKKNFDQVSAEFYGFINCRLVAARLGSLKTVQSLNHSLRKNFATSSLKLLSKFSDNILAAPKARLLIRKVHFKKL